MHLHPECVVLIKSIILEVVSQWFSSNLETMVNVVGSHPGACHHILPGFHFCFVLIHSSIA